MVKRREMDFTVGPLLKKMILYSLPIIGVNVLQLLFTTADLAVLGVFTGNDNALAAVGAATPIVNLVLAFFTGLSISANVLIARCVGKKDQESSRKYVGTSIYLSIVFGVILMIFGVILAEQMLLWTNCAKGVLPYATTYLRIYFLGMPLIMLYNFCAAILRAVGDTTRPLIFLIVAGVMNVILNVFFVVVVGLDIEGVAIATVFSNGASAVLSCVIMIKGDGYSKIEKQHLRFYKAEIAKMFEIGVPLAISKCLFSFSNVLVSAQLNALGESAMAAQSITKEFDGFILEIMHALGASTIAVVSQNYGAKKMDRIKRVLFLSLIMQSVCSLILCLFILLFGRALCGIMTNTKEVLDLCWVRITTVSAFYFLLGFLNIIIEGIRGIGYSLTATLISVFSNIVLRLIYIFFVYPALYIADNVAHNLKLLYALYPICWGISSVVGGVILVVLFKKVKKLFENEKTALEVETANQNNI